MIFNLFNSETPVLIQGMTGKEGMRMAAWMQKSGTRVVAGVTPGKGGQENEGRPIFNSVAEARSVFPDCVVSSVVVPPSYVRGAVREALEAGVTFIHVLTENVPVQDVLEMRALAARYDASILGPSSVGLVQFPKFRLGFAGGEDPFTVIREGGVAVVSASGGMTNEIAMHLAAQGVGLRLVLAVGGDRVPGLTLEEAIEAVAALPEVTALALFMEPGNPCLGRLARGEFLIRKPAAILFPGDALEQMPKGLPYGHTGTVLGEEEGSLATIRAAITDRGTLCVATPEPFYDFFMTYV